MDKSAVLSPLMATKGIKSREEKKSEKLKAALL